ncbi:MAG: N-6 DNA methylase [Deltaproteobacteria bacterium]|nr:N-6 DNA methylase [Deltaproteobacteria bacterium]
MLDKDTKQNINAARNILVGKTPDPKAQIDQITNALIYKFMDDMDRENESLGGKAQFLTGDLKEYSWKKLTSLTISGAKRWEIYTEALEKFAESEQIPELFRSIFKGAYLPFKDPETLRLFLKEIDKFSYDNSENLGNAFEYLLSVLGSQGDAGQFRTPRHIIDFIVEVINPQKNDSILDPACGTSGFLISSYKHICRENSSNYKKEEYIPTFAETKSADMAGVEIQKNGKYKAENLSPEQKKRLSKRIIGYDISPDMVKLSKVNLYLHGFSEPKIYEYDTLTSEERWEDSFNVILANPPFMSPTGGIRPHKKFQITAKRAELLFVDYIAEHLAINGKAGIIVPEGIIFKNENAYKALRKMLIKENYLYAVASLPAGIFKPYSGVKTSILFLDKQIAKNRDQILFVKILNDGFDLGAQRRRINKNDLPQAFKILQNWQQGKKTKSEPALFINKSKIAEDGDYNLTGDRYKTQVDYSKVKWDIVELGDVCEILDSKRKPIAKSKRKKGEYPYYGATGILDYVESYLFDEKLVLIGEDGAKWGVGDETAFIATGKYWVNNHAHVIRPNRKKILDKLLIELINNMDITPYITGVTVPKLNQKKLRAIKIPLPPLDVQRQIVSEIDGYQKIIDGARQIVENWKPIIKIDPNWETVKLGEVCSFVRGPFGGSLKKNIFKKRGYAVYEQSHAITGDFSAFRYFIDEQKFNEMIRFEVKPNDLIMSCSGTMGKLAIIPQETKKGIINQALLKLTTYNIFDVKFLKLFMESDIFQNNLLSNTGGAAIKNIASVKVLQRLKIPLPPLEVQRQIVSEIEKEEKIIENCKQLIEIHNHKIKKKIAEIWE